MKLLKIWYISRILQCVIYNFSTLNVCQPAWNTTYKISTEYAEIQRRGFLKWRGFSHQHSRNLVPCFESTRVTNCWKDSSTGCITKPESKGALWAQRQCDICRLFRFHPRRYRQKTNKDNEFVTVGAVRSYVDWESDDVWDESVRTSVNIGMSSRISNMPFPHKDIRETWSFCNYLYGQST